MIVPETWLGEQLNLLSSSLNKRKTENTENYDFIWRKKSLTESTTNFTQILAFYMLNSLRGWSSVAFIVSHLQNSAMSDLRKANL